MAKRPRATTTASLQFGLATLPGALHDGIWPLGVFWSLVIGSLVISSSLVGAEIPTPAEVHVIDLPAALRLAGAQNLDIQIAVQTLAEAKANQESARWQFLPSLIPGASYRRHDNLIQDTGGSIISTHKQAYTVGPTLAARVDIGDAIYQNLASRQLVKAASYALETQRQDAILGAAQGYFDLARAHLAVAVAHEAVAISTNYAGQVQQALAAGIAFKGDLLRIQVETEKNLLILRQAQEQQRVSSARLAQTLRLDSMVELAPDENELLPIDLVSTNATLDSLVAQALEKRPEVRQNQALVAAAREAKKGARYGPIIPSAGAQVFAGGLGGGRDGTPSTFGESEDYLLTLGWRIGPGGLFDQGRIHATEARFKLAQLSVEKLLDDISREVIESHTRLRSQGDQIATARRAIQAAEEALRLTRERKEFGVGAVLETIQAEQDLTRARLDYLNAIAEYNKAQYATQKAIGGLLGTQSSSQKP